MDNRRSDPPQTPEHIHGTPSTQRNNDTPGGPGAFLRRLSGPHHDVGGDGNFQTPQPAFNRRDSIYAPPPPPVNRRVSRTSDVPLLPPSIFTPSRRGGAMSPIQRILSEHQHLLSEHQHQQATDSEERILQIELNYVRGQVLALEERLRAIRDNQHRSSLRVESPSDFRNENRQELFKPLIQF